MQAVLSKSLINSLLPKDKPYEVRDTRTPGLLLRVQPTGSMTYYLELGRGRRMKIGPVSTPIDDVRTAAMGHLGAIAMGKDPVKVQKQAHGLTFLAFLDQEYEPWAKAHLKSAKRLLQRLRSNARRFHSKLPSQITPQEFEKWRTARLKAGKKRGTVNRDLDDVRAVLTKAKEWGFIDVNPLGGVKKLKLDKFGVVRFLTTEEDSRLFAQLDIREAKIRQARDSHNDWLKTRGHPLLPTLHNQAFADHIKPMVIVSLHTGLRQGELFGLQWSDVDLAFKRITVRGENAKSQQTRHIPLNDVCLQAFSNWRDQCPDDADLVFPGRDGGRFDTVKTAWNKVLKDAKVLRFRWHDLRHTFASRLVMKSVDLNTVRELLGHADLQMTLRYAHLAPEHKADAVAKLVA